MLSSHARQATVGDVAFVTAALLTLACLTVCCPPFNIGHGAIDGDVYPFAFLFGAPVVGWWLRQRWDNPVLAAVLPAVCVKVALQLFLSYNLLVVLHRSDVPDAGFDGTFVAEIAFMAWAGSRSVDGSRSEAAPTELHSST